MKIETFEMNILIPNENHFLLNEKEKVICEKVYIGKGALVDDWREITDEEKDAFQKEWEKDNI